MSGSQTRIYCTVGSSANATVATARPAITRSLHARASAASPVRLRTCEVCIGKPDEVFRSKGKLATPNNGLKLGEGVADYGHHLGMDVEAVATGVLGRRYC